MTDGSFSFPFVTFQVLSSSSLSYIYILFICLLLQTGWHKFSLSIYTTLVLVAATNFGSNICVPFLLYSTYLPTFLPYLYSLSTWKWNMCIILWCERDFQNDKWLLSVMSVIYQKSLLTRFQNISVFFHFGTANNNNK